MQIKLSDRLRMSADMVEPCSAVADVGCDHAHTCIWLLQNNVAGKCIGMDVRKGPLKKAEENLRLYGYSDRVELRLSYGIDELKPGEAEAVIIAGMGGEMIRDILERDKTAQKVLSAGKSPVLVLQPQSHYHSVRRWLYDNGFSILKEDICREDDKFYQCIKAARSDSGMVKEKPSSAELYFGPCLLKNRHPVLKEFLEIEYRKKKYLLEQIGKSTNPASLVRRAEVEELFGIICEACILCGAVTE